MATSVDYIYTQMRFLTRKNQAGGINQGDFGISWNTAQKSFQADLMGRFNRNTNSKLRLDTGLIENETILTKLLPFTIPLTAQPIAGGRAIKPAGLIYTLALRINGTKVVDVNKDQIWAINEDVIDPPSITDNSYYYTEYLDYYSFLPATVTAYDLDYIAAPTDVLWAYNLDDNNRQVYNAGASVQPQWNDIDCSEITQRALKLLGVSFSSQDFTQFGSGVINTGD